MKRPTRTTAPEKCAESTARQLPAPPQRRKQVVPLPSAAFRARQRELADLIHAGSPKGKWWEREAHSKRRKGLVEALASEFMVAFGLTKDKGKLAFRFFNRLTDADWPRFDHVTFYRRGENIFLVSQPYCLNEEKLSEWCERHDAVSYAVVDEWAHYYPGEATCFYVEFQRAMKTRKRKGARR